MLIHKTFKGDISKAVKYLPFALQKARELGEGVYETRCYHVDGVDIKVSANGGHRRVDLDARRLSIESGALILGHAGTGYIEAVDTCVVYRAGLSDIINDKTMGTWLMPSKAKPPTTPDDPFQSVVYRLKLTHQPANPPLDPSDFTNEMGELDPTAYRVALHPDRADLLRRKLVLRHLNPSKATGKMRLFLQALLGSVTNRITLSTGLVLTDFLTFAYLDKYLRIDPSYYLIRDKNGDYWMMDKAKAYHLEFFSNEVTLATLSELRSGGLSREREMRLETVLFSQISVPKPTQAQIDAALETNTTPQSPGWYPCLWPTPTGTPLQYDWHFAYQQNRAIRVGQTAPAKPEAGAQIRGSVFEELVFTTGAKNDDGSVSPPTPIIRIIERGDWSVVYHGNNFVWNIDPYTNTQFTDAPFPWGATTGVFDAPVYAFFDKNDVPIIVRHARSNTSDTTTTAPFDKRNSCNLGEWGQDITVGKNVVGGFYIGGVADCIGSQKNTSGSWRQSDTLEKTYYSFASSNQGGAQVFLTPGCDGSPGVPVHTVPINTYTENGVFFGTATHYLDDIGVGGETTQSFILFPLDNPDAIYIGKQELINTIGVKATSVSTFAFSDVLIDDSGYHESKRRFSGSEGTVSDDDVVSYQEFTSKETVSLITQHHNIQLSDHSWKIRTENNIFMIVEKASDWNTIFQPDPYATTYITRHYDVRESTGGRLWYDYDRVSRKTIPASIPLDDIYFIGYA